ncbi:MAG: leucyl aminopeptidase [Planctomycetota bacterium]|nr:leucyl aminopeptidase [Planctomycetota bacterium]
MEIHVVETALGRLKAAAVVLFAAQGESLRKRASACGQGYREALETLESSKSFSGEAGQVRTLTGGGKERIARVVLVGLGKRAKLTHEGLRHAAGAGVRAARELGAREVALAMPEGKGAFYRAETLAESLTEGSVVGLYRFENYKRKSAEDVIERISVLAAPAQAKAARRGLKEGRVLGEAVCFARQLGNEPGNVATPTFLATEAARIAEAHGLGLQVLEEDDMRALGMGSLLGVSQGSSEPAKLIILTYEPPARGKKRPETVAIVGKGLTFDTGGISIKPAAKLEDMKFDMCGGAAVLGAMQAVAGLQIGVRVVGLVPASENMPDAAAYKPGDILRAMNGTTIEIRNTDAEGRLILADALAYATSKLKPKPKAIVDLATLTGACVVALGDGHAGLVSNTDGLAAELLAASAESGDAIWRLPLTDTYRAQLESPYADLSNLGSPGAGTLTAAAFLENFTGDVPWAHLDIAGMAWTAKKSGNFLVGATGFGVRVIARWLQSRG